MPVRPGGPAFARFASSGGFESDEARSVKAESGDPARLLKNWGSRWSLPSGRPQAGPVGGSERGLFRRNTIML